MCTGVLSPGGKTRPERDGDHSPPMYRGHEWVGAIPSPCASIGVLWDYFTFCLNERHCLVYIHACGRMILKRVLKKWGLRAWAGFSLLRMRSNDSLLWTRWWTLWFHKGGSDFLTSWATVNFFNEISAQWSLLGSLLTTLLRAALWELLFTRILLVTISVTGWYRTKRPMHCDHFLVYCASPSEL
jgi:hypothetical protein